MSVSAAVQKLQADVAAERSASQAAIVLLQGLKTQLDAAIAANANGDDGAALADLSASLEDNTSGIAAAVVANTPAATDGSAPAASPAAAPVASGLPPAADGASDLSPLGSNSVAGNTVGGASIDQPVPDGVDPKQGADGTTQP